MDFLDLIDEINYFHEIDEIIDDFDEIIYDSDEITLDSDEIIFDLLPDNVLIEITRYLKFNDLIVLSKIYDRDVLNEYICECRSVASCIESIYYKPLFDNPGSMGSYIYNIKNQILAKIFPSSYLPFGCDSDSDDDDFEILTKMIRTHNDFTNYPIKKQPDYAEHNNLLYYISEARIRKYLYDKSGLFPYVNSDTKGCLSSNVVNVVCLRYITEKCHEYNINWHQVDKLSGYILMNSAVPTITDVISYHMYEIEDFCMSCGGIGHKIYETGCWDENEKSKKNYEREEIKKSMEKVLEEMFNKYYKCDCEACEKYIGISLKCHKSCYILKDYWRRFEPCYGEGKMVFDKCNNA
jgi:hypothetical protein